MMSHLFIGFLLVLLYKVTVNSIRYFECKKFKKEYFEWLKEQNPTFPTNRRHIIDLFTNAQIQDLRFPTAKPVGYGKIATFNSSVFTNFPSNIENQVHATVRFFDEATGVYRERIFESFNPIYWINLIIFLPKNVLHYLGVKPENVLVKIVQIIWWFLGVLIGVFKDEIIQNLRSIITIKLF